MSGMRDTQYTHKPLGDFVWKEKKVKSPVEYWLNINEPNESEKEGAHCLIGPRPEVVMNAGKTFHAGGYDPLDTTEYQMFF